MADGVEAAVIFVHGFLGDAISTWEHFPSLIDICLAEYRWWATVDAYFYNYSGTVHKPIAVHAEELHQFLDMVFPSPSSKFFQPSFAPEERLRPDGFTYKKLVLVGHSEGAVVIRRALVSQYKLVRHTRPLPQARALPGASTTYEDVERAARQFLQANPKLDAKLVLFSPAHLGASLTGWLGLIVKVLESMKCLGPTISSLTGYDELKKESPVLLQLKQDTEAFAGEIPYCPAFRAQAYFGSEDRTVYIGEYTTDLKSIIVKNQGHSSVCKPNASYKEPLQYVSHEQK